MIAEEYKTSNIDSYRLPHNKSDILAQIYSIMVDAVVDFRKVIKQRNIMRPLNEDKYTQLYVQQVAVKLRKNVNSIDIGSQYLDVFEGKKGIPDFYFYLLEEGVTNKPILVVEAKLIPASKVREYEYVIGNDKKNGGIQRFKHLIHGSENIENGMLGLIKENSPLYWFNKFNLFIEELDNLGKDNWSKQEQLVNLENNSNYCIYESKVIRVGSTPNMKLRHLWIQI